MSSKSDVTTDDLTYCNTYLLQALINVLERKGLLTRKEVLDELEAIKEIVCGDEN